MKNKIKLLTVLITVSLFIFSSCKKDEEIAKPSISNLEVGLNNSKIGYIGSDLHLEAEIVAEGTISTVNVEIHPEGTATWTFDTTFTEFSGLKNTTFHKHIDIPATAEAGNYHLHFTVTDQQGNETTVESELELQTPTDTVAPQINVISAPANGQAYSTGDTISISGTISDETALGGIYIGLVRVDQALTDADVNADNTITLHHFHDFTNPLSYNFAASIVVGAAYDNDITPDAISWGAGSYYLLIKCKDAFGGNWTFSAHYPITIN